MSKIHGKRFNPSEFKDLAIVDPKKPGVRTHGTGAGNILNLIGKSLLFRDNTTGKDIWLNKQSARKLINNNLKIFKNVLSEEPDLSSLLDKELDSKVSRKDIQKIFNAYLSSKKTPSSRLEVFTPDLIEAPTPGLSSKPPRATPKPRSPSARPEVKTPTAVPVKETKPKSPSARPGVKTPTVAPIKEAKPISPSASPEVKTPASAPLKETKPRSPSARPGVKTPTAAPIKEAKLISPSVSPEVKTPASAPVKEAKPDLPVNGPRATPLDDRNFALESGNFVTNRDEFNTALLSDQIQGKYWAFCPSADGKEIRYIMYDSEDQEKFNILYFEADETPQSIGESLGKIGFKPANELSFFKDFVSAPVKETKPDLPVNEPRTTTLEERNFALESGNFVTNRDEFNEALLSDQIQGKYWAFCPSADGNEIRYIMYDSKEQKKFNILYFEADETPQAMGESLENMGFKPANELSFFKDFGHVKHASQPVPVVIPEPQSKESKPEKLDVSKLSPKNLKRLKNTFIKNELSLHAKRPREGTVAEDPPFIDQFMERYEKEFGSKLTLKELKELKNAFIRNEISAFIVRMLPKSIFEGVSLEGEAPFIDQLKVKYKKEFKIKSFAKNFEKRVLDQFVYQNIWYALLNAPNTPYGKQYVIVLPEIKNGLEFVKKQFPNLEFSEEDWQEMTQKMINEAFKKLPR